jgi:hypothetical protein
MIDHNDLNLNVNGCGGSTYTQYFDPNTGARLTTSSYQKGTENIVTGYNPTGNKDDFTINASSLSNTLWGLSAGVERLRFQVKMWYETWSPVYVDFWVEVRNKCYGSIGTLTLGLSAA